MTNAAKKIIDDYDKKYANKHGMTAHLGSLAAMRKLAKLIKSNK